MELNTGILRPGKEGIKAHMGIFIFQLQLYESLLEKWDFWLTSIL